MPGTLPTETTVDRGTTVGAVVGAVVAARTVIIIQALKTRLQITVNKIVVTRVTIKTIQVAAKVSNSLNQRVSRKLTANRKLMAIALQLRIRNRSYSFKSYAYC